ncbi:hypothetical protein AVEN_47240-1 [Araneus ventricosus]|uniref:Uncharacterized protein n=1 Tax=Araneus ventricosus TaxID=182803 RepID=A0A4Y2P2J9_ARAVE|nr:hypothetical protein AVEN_47240-1 [Araneus ventricosus]
MLKKVQLCELTIRPSIYRSAFSISVRPDQDRECKQHKPTHLSEQFAQEYDSNTMNSQYLSAALPENTSTLLRPPTRSDGRTHFWSIMITKYGTDRFLLLNTMKVNGQTVISSYEMPENLACGL